MTKSLFWGNLKLDPRETQEFLKVALCGSQGLLREPVCRRPRLTAARFQHHTHYF